PSLGGASAAPGGGLAGGLGQQQAVAGLVQIEAPAAGLAQQALMIAGRVGPEERQAEAVLPLDGAVTGAGVAAQAAEERDDVAAEADGGYVVGAGGGGQGGGEQGEGGGPGVGSYGSAPRGAAGGTRRGVGAFLCG